MRTTFLLLLALTFSIPAQAAPARPKLVLTVVIDQFRADYLTRFESRFLPARSKSGEVGGFKYLMDQGAYFPLGEYMMLQCETGPGHATILSGAYPYMTGIGLNIWFDQALFRPVYCVEDPKEAIVGLEKPEAGKGVSPRNFQGTTFGDEIKNAGIPSRVIAISLKDRSAVLLGGRRADLALWFEPKELRWVSSRYYLPNGTLPEWVNALNAKLEKRKGEKIEWKAPTEKGTGFSSEDKFPMEESLGATFPHKAVLGDRASMAHPVSAELTEQAAISAFDFYKMGRGKGTDLLAVSISGHDYVGHGLGPNSREAEEITIFEDRLLSRLFNHLRKALPGGLKDVVVVLTADHGVQVRADQAREWKYEAGRIDQVALAKKLSENLNDKYGKPSQGDWIPYSRDLNFWLNAKAIQDKKLDRAEVEGYVKQQLLQVEGVSRVVTSSELADRKYPPGILEKQTINTTFTGRNGDLVIIPKIFYTHQDTSAANHVTGYNYDRRVPIAFAGPGIKPGRYATSAEVVDIAPTLSFITGVLPPALSHGRVLSEILK